MKWMTFVCLCVLECGFAQHNVAFLKTAGATSLALSVPRAAATLSPVQVVGGMVFVNAQLEHTEGRFLLDTGAPMLVLNQSSAQNAMQTQAASLGTTFSVANTKVRKFQWANITRKNLSALVLDIRHLEQFSNLSINGIIGYDLLKNFEIFFDYSNQQVMWLQAGKNQLHTAAEPLVAIPFELQGHLPVIELQIGGQKLRFGLDTGAGINLLSQSFEALLDIQHNGEPTVETVQAIDQSKSKLTSSWASDNQINGVSIGKMKYALADLSSLNADKTWQIDGLLGYPFFSRLKWSIDYPNRVLYLWEVE